MQGLFITGTDTGVGKTFVVSNLAKHLSSLGIRVGLYKPVCSGAEHDAATNSWHWPDVDKLSAALGNSVPIELICPQRFRAPLAPPEAAWREGKRVNSDELRSGAAAWRSRCEILLVEGVGGWKCPLTKDETVADLAEDLGFPVLVVAENRLGVVNHTLLTMESIQRSGLELAGVVLNDTGGASDESRASNPDLLARLLGPAWLGHLSFQKPEDVPSETRIQNINWMEIIKKSPHLGHLEANSD